ncbi:response regulator [Kiritimatiellota bacterium B12222]|nr:response regulator [Kiritimatiellota bacterium B12222]
MQNETLQDLIQQKEKLEAQVFALRMGNEFPTEQQLSLPLEDQPVDPELAATLNTLFQIQPKGRKEFLRMDIDILRRVCSSRESEQIFRAFGVLYLATPVRVKGKIVHALFSGPLKVCPWTPQEKETLAQLCGLSTSELPSRLDQSPIYAPKQVEMLLRQQNKEAQWLSLLLSTSPAHPTTTPTSTSVGMELLQPGFADHLDLLFCTVQREVKHPAPLSDEGRKRLQTVAQRGRHLASQIRQMSEDTFANTEQVSVHHILEKWADHFGKQHPSLRLNLRLQASESLIEANPHQLEHMLFTLMASIADGLPEAAAVMGISTRNDLKDGLPVLHLEIRDGGGLATFAGVGGEIDHRVLSEQNEAAAEFSDWFTLASRMDAELKVLKEENIISRAELFLPLNAQTCSPSLDGNPDGFQLWIVEDDDREYESLLHMLSSAGFNCSRFTSASDLRTNFSLANSSPDMVILKYHLPDQRGAEVRSWIYEQDSSLPVILISGLQATHPGIATANSLPSTLYLQKPFDSQSLLDMVRMNLDDTLPG